MTANQAHPRIVLLPGMDGTGLLFKPFLRELPAAFVPMVVSYPAQRTTTTDALVALVEQSLPRDRTFALVAESFSGRVALRIAARAPTGLCAVVLVASFIRSPVGRALSAIAPRVPGLFVLPFTNLLVRRFLVGNDAPEDLVRGVSEAVRSVRPAVLVNRLRQIMSEDVSDEAARCPVPMLYIAGTRDRVVSPRSEAALRMLRPDLQTTFVDAPHLILHTCPVEAVRCIVEFLGRCC